MDDVVPSRSEGPFPGPIWQGPRSLERISSATSGRECAETLALYVTLTEHADEEIEQRTGLSRDQIDGAMETLVNLGLVRDGMLAA